MAVCRCPCTRVVITARACLQRWFRPALADRVCPKTQMFSVRHRTAYAASTCPAEVVITAGYQRPHFAEKPKRAHRGHDGQCPRWRAPFDHIVVRGRPSARAVCAGGSAFRPSRFHRCMHDGGPPVACCSIALDANGSIDLLVQPLG